MCRIDWPTEKGTRIQGPPVHLPGKPLPGAQLLQDTSSCFHTTPQPLAQTRSVPHNTSGLPVSCSISFPLHLSHHNLDSPLKRFPSTRYTNFMVHYSSQQPAAAEKQGDTLTHNRVGTYCQTQVRLFRQPDNKIHSTKKALRQSLTPRTERTCITSTSTLLWGTPQHTNERQGTTAECYSYTILSLCPISIVAFKDIQLFAHVHPQAQRAL